MSNIIGTLNNDILTGTALDDVIIGRAGDDLLNGGAGNDFISAGSGDDTVIGSAGSDTIDGGPGLDTRDYSQFGRAITIEPGRINKGNGEFDFGTGFEIFIGALGFANAIDASSSTSPTTSIDVDLSTDRLTIVDSILGSFSLTVQNFVNVTGTIADDTIKGDSGNNVIDGGAGNDIIIGSGGSDTVTGGSGADVLDYSQFGRAITIEAMGINKGNGQFDSPTDFIETVIGAAGFANAIDASTSPSPTASIDVDLSTERLTLIGIPGGDIITTVRNFVNVTGTVADDIIKGDNGNNVIDGGAGNDRIIGSGGSDTFTGGAGADVLDYSQFGRAITIEPDRINKGNGQFDTATDFFDTIIGAVGFANAIDASTSSSPTVSIDVDLSADRLTLVGTSLGDLSVTVQNFVNVTGTTLGDRISGDTGSNVLDGDRGADRILGRAGADTLFGRSAADTLEGGSGADLLRGGRGDDVLIGGSGTDTLEGGSGADIFVIKPNSDFDVITDFEVGIDKLDLSAFNFLNIQEAAAAGIFGGVNDSIPGFTFTLLDFGVTVAIESRDLPLPAADIIV